MREIIDRILDLESKATEGPWDQEMFDTYYMAVGPECRRPFQAVRDQNLINMMRNNIKPLLLRMKALEDLAEVAKKMRKRNFGRIDEFESVLDKLDDTEGMDGATNKT